MSPKPSLQALNYLWIAINYPTTETILKGREAACPIPETYIDNVAATAAANPNVDVYLWIDKRRHTDQELAALSARVKSCQTSDNIQIRDLCEIPEYHCRFFAQAETSPSWRTNKHSLIWRQVDAAKFLVCFQGGYEQAFFADMDLVNISISSEAAQKPITSHGWVVGVREMPDDKLAFENQFFGFTSRQKPIFKRAYDIAIKEVWLNGYE